MKRIKIKAEGFLDLSEDFIKSSNTLDKEWLEKMMSSMLYSSIIDSFSEECDAGTHSIEAVVRFVERGE